MTAILRWTWAGLAFALGAAGVPAAQVPGPFDVLEPAIRLRPDDRKRAERGETLVVMAPAGPREIAAVAITRTSLTADRLVAWSKDVERLKDSPMVRRVKKLSPAATRGEFDGMWLSDDDVRDLGECRIGSCKLKLTREEIEAVRREYSDAGKNWKDRAHTVFQDIAFARVREYNHSGLGGVPPYADGNGGPSRGDAFRAVMERSPFLSRHAPAFAQYLSAFPNGSAPGERFVYWSIEEFGAKPVISATEVVITEPSDSTGPLVIVAGKQVFATHYSLASLNITMLVADAGGNRYLVVVNRSSIDLLGGAFGGVVRRVLEKRVKSELDDIVDRVKKRMEAGNPSAVPNIPRTQRRQGRMPPPRA